MLVKAVHAAFDAPCIPLDHLPRGGHAILRRIHSSEARFALLNMGIMPGDVLELTDVNLGGCPIAFRVRSTKVALRRAVAATVEVEPVERDPLGRDALEPQPLPAAR